MNWGVYGLLVVLALFILLLVFYPNLSCFGRRIRSPFYPLFRKKARTKRKVEDYGFRLVEGEERKTISLEKKPQNVSKRVKVEDYGFKLVEKEKNSKIEKKAGDENKGRKTSSA